ncbi:MAG: DNA replication and repair protein RecF [Verrucomicrobiota bacterium]
MIESLVLENFRCHPLLELSELGRRNCLQGANGQGKTSILEAIYLLSRCKSFRTPRIPECAGWGKRSFGLAASVQGVDEVERLKYEWSTSGRQLSINHESNLKLEQFWGKLPAIAITNADREMVKGSGSNRRNWIDSLIAGQDHSYLLLVQKAALLQRQKNAILKSEQVDRGLWTILSEQMKPLMEEMVEKREKMTELVGGEIELFYQRLTESEEKIGFTYQSESARRLEKSLDQIWENENRSRNCELGPHRDDWEMSLDKKSLRHFGSEGQQKSAALAMRLAEAEFLDDSGAVLIDDALMELDLRRRKRFWSLLPEDRQLFFASTNVESDQAYAGFDLRLEILRGGFRKMTTV